MIKITCLTTAAFTFALFALFTPAYAQSIGQVSSSVVTPESAFSIMAGNAEKGDATAMLNLGICYEHGIGVSRNYSKALAWYQKAADNGVAEGYYNVGVCYEIGMGDKADPQKAAAYFLQSAEMGFAQGMFKMADIYLVGFGVQQNDTNSFELLNKAARSGHPAAMNAMGAVYAAGTLGQPMDEKIAVEWFQRAADAGNLEAIKNMAVVYKNGVGVKTDPVNALLWYTIAKNGGYAASDMDAIIEELKAAMKPADLAKIETDAAKWFLDFQDRHPQQ